MTALTIQDCMQRAFAPTPRGVAGLTEQLLRASAGGGLELERMGEQCICRCTVNGDTQETPVPLRPAAFQTVLAWIAELCQERSPGSVTPYGGECLLPIPGDPATVVWVHFVNTPEKQQLQLNGVTEQATEEAASILRPSQNGCPAGHT
jgi:hypothetical protein